MSEQSRVEANPLPIADVGATPAELDAKRCEYPPLRPHLQGFGPGTGPFEFELGHTSVTIGRSDLADIQLPHHTVSRIHASVALCGGEYVIEDANSAFGTIVNGQPMERHVLRHGDSIQISLYVLQYRTHTPVPGAAAAAQKAKALLRMEFCLLPSTMRLKYRVMEITPRDVFKTGDTLKVGNGGLLIPTTQPPPEGVCLELRLFWPNDQNKRYLGEILGTIPGDTCEWLCVKLHSVPKEIHRLIVSAAKHGDWLDVAPT